MDQLKFWVNMFKFEDTFGFSNIKILTMAKNIINMILWHPEMDINKAKITYVHRGAKGNLKTINGDFIEGLKGGFLILKDGTQIPCHRIVKIELKDRLLWKK